MTFVGKILVIVILIFSLVFLGISTVAFTTAKNWMVATKSEQTKATELQKKLTDAQAAVEAAKKGLEDAKGQFDQEKKNLDTRLATLTEENARNLAQITDVRGKLGVAEQTANSTLQEVAAKRDQTNQLRTQITAVEKQANDFKLHQAELNDRIRELERQLETATKNNSDLRERVAKFSTLLQRNGLSTDISQIKGLESPPPVTGEVKRVNATNNGMEITIGSDDGLVVGHHLYMYRLTPSPEYLAQVEVVSVDPDQSVVKVVGKTYLGRKIKEGDIVSSSVKPRF